MNREHGTFPSLSYEREEKGNLDKTKYFPSFATLLDPTQHKYPYNQMLVEVNDADPAKAGIYRLVDETKLNEAGSWEKLGIGSAAFDMKAFVAAAPLLADEAAATAANLPTYTIYKTPTGELRYKLPPGQWILATGQWMDAGEWKDLATWKDNSIN